MKVRTGRVGAGWALGMLAAVAATGCGVDRRGLGWIVDDDADPATGRGNDSDGGGRPTRGSVDDPNAPGGGGGGDGGGAGGPGAGTDKAGPGLCGSYRIPVTNQTPEFMVVLDRSGSMRENGVDRWGPSIAAVDSVVHARADAMRFGLLMFPGDCGSLQVPNEQLACSARLVAESALLSCEPGRVNVAIGSGNADAIGTALKNTGPLGATPTASAIEAAADTLVALPSGPNTGSRAILLVTDGAPNCALGVGGLAAVGIAPSSAQPEAVTQTVGAIEDAAARGIKTYVIGYDTKKDAYLSSTLDRMASAGGTGDTQHRPVEDQNSLLGTLDGLSKRTLLCDLVLDAPTDPALVRVVLGGKTLARDPLEGWWLGTDGRSLSLRGQACAAVSSNPDQLAEVQVECPRPPASDAGGPDAATPIVI